MNAGASSSSSSAEAAARLRRLPDAARAALLRFQANGHPADLDAVLFAMMEDSLPHKPAVEFSRLPGSTRLVEDLHCDSLALAELVFALEDIFGIRVKNDEIVGVQTLDDLRACVRRKLSGRSGTPA